MTQSNTLDDVNPDGKRVLVRVDLNVPISEDENGGVSVTDTTRMERIAPTINEISDKGGKVILLAHFGRPKGKIIPQMSLAPILSTLSEVIGKPIAFSTDCIGPMAEAAVGAMQNGDILLMENTRFHAGEEANNKQFTADLAANGDIFVSDAFSASHRAHASTVGLAAFLPAYAGRTMQAELEALEAGLGNPSHPVVALVGGAKVSSKLDLLKNLVLKVDALVIGGGMANTFLAAQGFDVGKSLCEHDLADTAMEILEISKKAGCAIVLPDDCVVAQEFAANISNKIVKVEQIPPNAMILDAGPDTVHKIGEWISRANTLIWNGPLGAFEITPFDRATVDAAKVAAAQTRAGKLISVAGGGDTVAALNHAGIADDFTYISTAGGAFLEWMEGKELPGVAVLQK
ncbi:MAG: phosphoglycerate kinase [Hyphomicrobiales bacterium]|nr:phosphoglycerate kinase [Hyphomicrobiales bacterium]